MAWKAPEPPDEATPDADVLEALLVDIEPETALEPFALAELE